MRCKAEAGHNLTCKHILDLRHPPPLKTYTQSPPCCSGQAALEVAAVCMALRMGDLCVAGTASAIRGHTSLHQQQGGQQHTEQQTWRAQAKPPDQADRQRIRLRHGAGLDLAGCSSPVWHYCSAVLPQWKTCMALLTMAYLPARSGHQT